MSVCGRSKIRASRSCRRWPRVRNSATSRPRATFGALLGAAAVALAPGCGSAVQAEPRGAQVVRFTVESKLVGSDLHEIGVIPSGGGKRPLLVLLHGRSMPPDAFLTDALFSALAGLGASAPDILLADGGDASYFHDRASGRWGSYVVREAIPEAVRELGADRRRVAIGGVSMGGFGALDVGRLRPGRFCAVGGHSPALWLTGGQTPQGAFDDAEDFARHDVFASARHSLHPYGRSPVWIDVGRDDPFRDAAIAYATLLKRRGQVVSFHLWDGGHTLDYWNGHMSDYLRFYSQALAHCA